MLGAVQATSHYMNKWVYWRIYALLGLNELTHDDVNKWKHFPRYWPFVRGIHRSPVNSPHKGRWRGALVFSLICAWMDGWGWWLETPSGPLWRQSNENDAETTLPSFCRRHFKTHLLEWNVIFCIQISLGFDPTGEINNIPTLPQIMAWCRPGDRPRPMMV